MDEPDYLATLYATYELHKGEVVMKPLTVESTVWLNTPIEKAWKAVTDPAQLEHWYAPGCPWEIPALQVGATIKFHNTQTETLSATIEALKPPHQFTLRWYPDTDYPTLTLVTSFRLQAENGGTAVTIHETGYEALPDAIRQKWMDDTQSGYSDSLAILKSHVEGLPQGEDAMSEEWTVRQSVWVDAPPESIWAAITEPLHLMQWWSPNQWEIPDLRVGGSVSFGLEGDMSHAVIETLEAPRQLTLRWQADEQFPTLVTTYLLDSENNGTRLTVTEAGFEALPEESRQKIFDRTAAGYGDVVQDLKAYIERSNV